uniref:BEACH-type PH domain-containing protein n=1 Tax=Haemonchus placei TaxID=6290 RepID=A0A0N4WVV7_HAEPC
LIVKGTPLCFIVQNSFIIGAEVDPSKYVSTASALDVPIPGLNEVFDFQEETLIKRDEELVDIRHTRFSLPIPSTDQRLPFKASLLGRPGVHLLHAKAHLFERFNDVNLNFAHVLPSINTHQIKTDDIVDEIILNRANPTLVG